MPAASAAVEAASNTGALQANTTNNSSKADTVAGTPGAKARAKSPWKLDAALSALAGSKTIAAISAAV
jgi:hypothetical protein